MAINIDSRYGGSELDMLSTCIAVEEISRGCAGTGIILSIHNCLYAYLLQTRGTDSQKEEYLRPYTTGKIGAFALSEHGMCIIVFPVFSSIIYFKIKCVDAGSDVANLSTVARQDGDHFVLNGIKAWVTSGYEAHAAIVFATINKSLKHKGITGKHFM